MPNIATDLDFYQTIQLINYIRTQARLGATTFDFSAASKPWVDDKYMQPVLEDDSLLYSIDELADPSDPKDPLVLRDDDEHGGAETVEGHGQRVLAERALQR